MKTVYILARTFNAIAHWLTYCALSWTGRFWTLVFLRMFSGFYQSFFFKKVNVSNIYVFC